MIRFAVILAFLTAAVGIHMGVKEIMLYINGPPAVVECPLPEGAPPPPAGFRIIC